MKGKKWLSLALAGMLAVSALAGCGSSSSSTGGADTASTSTGSADYDLYIFNNKGENADAMAAAAEAFGEEKGVTVKVFSLGSGVNSDDTLRTEMNSKNKPAIFSCMNSESLVEWTEGGFAMDLSKATNEEFVMRSVNANLLEINQAKSRINQAKKEGTTPDPKDLELVKTEKQNAFAISQYTDIMTIEKFAKHITSHGSVYSRADISAILYIAVDCMREMLLEGKKIRLGDLGDFSLLLTSKGAEDADKFTAQNITGVKVQWEPGQEFKNLRDDAEFNLVASRSAQAAVIKAIKEGKTNVDLNAPTTPDNTPGGSTPGGSNTGQTGSDGQGSESGGGTTGKDDTGDGLE